jgi:hypothetical protein
MESGFFGRSIVGSADYDAALAIISAALTSAGVRESVVTQAAGRLKVPAVLDRVMANTNSLVRHADLFVALYDVLEIFQDLDEVVKEWVEEHRYVHVKAAPPTSSLPPKLGSGFQN